MERSLNSLIKRGTLVLPGVYDGLSAMLAEKAGFKAIYISGAGLSNSRGLPDTGVLSRADFIRLVSYIISAVSIPAIVDADTGFGGPAEVKNTVRLLEGAGAWAIQIEDQVWPKRCGHLANKTLISAQAFAEKLKAAAAARRKERLLIIARTDARAVEGIEGAVARALIYKNAGADIVFPEALENRDEFLLFSKAVKGPLMANMTEFGKTPYINAKEFNRLGYSMVLFPMTALRVAAKAVENAYKNLKLKGTQKGLLESMQTRKELYKLLKYEPC
ncbi:MAG: methylisocitrate lyase [Deltaproteobacteria bacterium]|nr:methylisocitrate lyase [Deltaproteobacteria bacterium]